MGDHRHKALIIVDNQTGAIDSNFWGTSRTNPSYEQNIMALLSAFRSLPGAHIIHVYHSSLNPASPLHPSNPCMGFHSSSLPTEGERSLLRIDEFAFIDSPLEGMLKEKQIWKIYFVGLSIDLCLGSTVRGASDLKVVDLVDEDGIMVKGEIILVGDGTAAWAKKGGKFDAETVHGVHLESLNEEFARVASTEEVLRELVLKE